MANECTLNEGDAHPCVVFGPDIGETLYTMGVMGLLAMATFPTGRIALVLFFLFNVWRRRANAPSLPQ